MIEILQEGKGRKIEFNHKNDLVYKSGSFFKLLKEWHKLKKAYSLNLNVPKPIKFIKQSLFKAQIIMSFIEGNTLENLVPNLSYVDRIKLAFSLGKTFKELNKHRLWHKDIHKGNIIVTSEGEIFLLDLYKLQKSLSFKISQIKQLAVLYGAFIKDLDIKIILSFLKGYLGNYKNTKEFIKKYGPQIREKGIKNLINILKKEISNLDNPRRFKKIVLGDWKGYLALRTNGLFYENEILDWLESYQKENKILGKIVKEGRSALVVKYKNICLKLFKKRMHKWKGLKDLLLYRMKYTRARKSFFNSYLFYFTCGYTPPPLAFFENKNGEGIFVTLFIEDSVTFSKFIEKFPDKEKALYINKLLKWYKKILDYNFISKDANLRNILVNSKNNIWLIDSLDIVYTNNLKKKTNSINRLLKDLKIYE